MNNILKVLILIIFLSSFTMHATSPNRSEKFRAINTSHTNLTPVPSLSQMDAVWLDSIIVEKMGQYHFPGLAACIVKDDKIIWKNNYGYANIEQKKLVTDSTLFYIASVSKTFTGTAIMQLWERGLFDLDDDVDDYLTFNVRNPNYPDVPITFRMLLTHTSSIHHPFVKYDDVTWGRDSLVELGDYIESFLNNSSNWNYWTPGTKWEYCSVSVDLLGYLVETITDMPFEKYCQDSIFVPLGMNEISWFLANLDVNKIATPYEYNGSYIPKDHWGVPGYPSNQIRTSLTQLARFMLMYMQGGQIDGKRILNRSTIDLMTTIHDAEIDENQGLIWGMYKFNVPDVGDRVLTTHMGGWDSGANSVVSYILGTGENVGIIILTNRRYDNGIIDIGLELLSYGLIYNKIHAQNIELNSTFMRTNTDTLILNSEYVNPNNHDFSANAIITSIDSAYHDSIPLYDDGNHGDLNASDGIWGNYILPMSTENEFQISFSTTDLVSNSHLNQTSQARFTTIGPVVFESDTIISSDKPPSPGDKMRFRFKLKNMGLSATAQNITARLICTDSSVWLSYYVPLYSSILTFYDIVPGKSVLNNRDQQIYFQDDNSGRSHFTLEIFSNGYHFWSDTFSIKLEPASLVEKIDSILPKVFSLKQNYPNPFNPSTKIKFDLPKPETVKLEVYNIIGQKIETLLHKSMPAGYHEVEFNGQNLSSGIYMYRIEAGEWKDVKKMILLR